MARIIGGEEVDVSDDFIGIIDGAFGDLCDRYLNYYKELEDKNLVGPRSNYHNHEVNDKGNSLFVEPWYQSYNIPYIKSTLCTLKNKLFLIYFIVLFIQLKRVLF